jgi:hypothetical protein
MICDKTKTAKAFFIGHHFYDQSKTAIGPWYWESGQRAYADQFQQLCEAGYSVTIRPATEQEKNPFELELLQIQKRLKA